MDIVFLIPVKLRHIIIDEIKRKVLRTYQVFGIKFTLPPCIPQVDMLAIHFIQSGKILRTNFF